MHTETVRAMPLHPSSFVAGFRIPPRRPMYNSSLVPGAGGLEGHCEGDVEGGVTSMAHTADVVIIGGGIIGASIAYHLRQDGLSGRLMVIERDTTYARATTPMSMGG